MTSKQQLTVVFTRRDACQQQQAEIFNGIEHHVECSDGKIQPLACRHLLLAKRVVVAKNCYIPWGTVQSNANSPDVTLRCVSTNSCTDRWQIVGNLKQYCRMNHALAENMEITAVATHKTCYRVYITVIQIQLLFTYSVCNCCLFADEL